MIYKDLRKNLALPDFFSLTGLIFSILSIFCALEENLPYAAAFFFAAAAFDYTDGRVARAVKRKGRYGAELDNLCDVVLYLICPAIFGYSAGLKSNLDIIVFIIFITLGVMRLARFALTGTKDGCYEGLPVSYSIIIPPLYFLLLWQNISINYMLLFYFIPSFLMISTIKVKKI